jgi:hypothetical protein
MAKKTGKRFSFSEDEWVSQRLELAIGGFAYLMLLYSACKFDLFSYLKRNPHVALKQISRDLELPEASTRVLLMACSTLGLVKRRGNGYSNSRFATFFERDSRASVFPRLNAYHSIIYRAMHSLPESLAHGSNRGLRELPGPGNTIYQRLTNNPELEKIFHAWMAGTTASGVLTKLIVPHLRPVITRMSHLVDYGGGDGENAMRLCREFPHLKVTIFDRPSVIDLAKEKVQTRGYWDRIYFKAGDFLRDPFIEGVDGVMFGHIVNIYSPESNIELFRKSYHSLNSKGTMIVFNAVCFDSEDGPISAPVLSAYFLGLATGEGMVYPLRDYDNWLRQAGFHKFKKLYIEETGHGLVLASKH